MISVILYFIEIISLMCFIVILTIVVVAAVDSNVLELFTLGSLIRFVLV